MFATRGSTSKRLRPVTPKPGPSRESASTGSQATRGAGRCSQAAADAGRWTQAGDVGPWSLAGDAGRPGRLLLLLAALAMALLGCDARGTGKDAAGTDAGPGQAAPDARRSSDAPPLDLRALAEGSYVGVVKVRVVPPEGSGMRPTTRNGTAGAGLETSGRLVVVGDVDKEADAGFAADGRFHDGGWSGGTGEVQLRIGADGAIRGGGEAEGNRMTIEGRIDKRRLDLYFEIELLAASPGGFPRGTRFQFRYDLYRPFKGAAGGNGRAPAGGCREVVYRNKLVPNLSGGAMGMVRVPECRR